MGNRIHALAQQLTGKATLEECELEDLQVIAQRYPYFAPAQFLLLQKLRQMGSAEEAEKQYKKAVLFYHDPLLFEHFISSNRFYVDEIMTSTVSEPQEQDALQLPEKHDLTPDSISGDPIELFDVDEQGDTIATDQAFHSNSSMETKVEEINESRETSQVEINVPADITPEEPISEETESVTQVNQQETALPPLTEKEKPETELTFEPYHTVDYFASQGIKISSDELPKDKLGKQLKSFTEWLKTMKRLPVAQMDETLESSVEKNVESMASHSVTESNVVTEAMAEVWAKQGNREKALDIYNKLSLLNPSKKAYFAAKIENLKQS